MAIERKTFDELLQAALSAIRKLCELQEQALRDAGADLKILMKRR
jgi:hypothetical protein